MLCMLCHFHVLCFKVTSHEVTGEILRTLHLQGSDSVHVVQNEIYTGKL